MLNVGYFKKNDELSIYNNKADYRLKLSMLEFA